MAQQNLPDNGSAPQWPDKDSYAVELSRTEMPVLLAAVKSLKDSAPKNHPLRDVLLGIEFKIEASLL